MADEEVKNVLRNLGEDFEKNLRLSMKVKCEFNGENRLLKTFARPLKLDELRHEVGRRYDLPLDVFFTMPNREYDVPILSQEDLDLVVKIVDEHQHLRSLSLLLKACPDPGRSSPPPGTLPPGSEPCADSGSIMTASTCSEGEFIPEPDNASNCMSSLSSSHKSIDVRLIAGSRGSMLSESASGQYQDDWQRGGRAVGGTFPKRMAPRVDNGKFTYPRQTMQHRESCYTGQHVFMQSSDSQSSVASSQLHSPSVPVNWTQGELLGQGAFGKVYKCHDNDSGRTFAMKAVQLEANHGPGAGREVKALEQEIQLLKNVSHERIVRYIGCLQDHQRICIFMEFMECGSVRDEIKRYGPLNETLARKYTRMVLEGLHFLHINLYVHRDIKGANILKDSQGNVKLADFGAAKQLKTLQSAASNTLIGTAPYIAPEVIRGAKFDRKCDIWSLGATVVEFLTGNPPYHHLENAACIIYRIVSDQSVDYSLPANVSSAADNFINSCFERRSDERPSAESLLLHKFCTEDALPTTGL